MKTKRTPERTESLHDHPVSLSDRSSDQTVVTVNRFVIDSLHDKDVLKRDDLLSFHNYYRGMRLKKFELPPVTSYRLRKLENLLDSPESTSKFAERSPRRLSDVKGSGKMGLYTDLQLSGFRMSKYTRGRPPCRNFPRMLSPIERPVEKPPTEQTKTTRDSDLQITQCAWTKDIKKHVHCPYTKNSPCALIQEHASYMDAHKNSPCSCVGLQSNTPYPSKDVQRRISHSCADVIMNRESSSTSSSSFAMQEPTSGARSVPADKIGWTSKSRQASGTSTTLADVLKINRDTNIIEPSSRCITKTVGIFSDKNMEFLNAKVDQVNKEWHTMLKTRLVDDHSYDVYARTDKTPD